MNNSKNHFVGELDDLSKNEIDILLNAGFIFFCEPCGDYHLCEGSTWDQINKILNDV